MNKNRTLVSRRSVLGAAGGTVATLAIVACGEEAANPDELKVQEEIAGKERSGGGQSAELSGGAQYSTTPTDMVGPIGIGQNDERKFIYVVDGNSNMFEFTKDGVLNYWSNGGTTTEEGQFSGPTDITQDRARQLWIADSGNSRIQKMNFYLGSPEGYLPKPDIWGDSTMFDGLEQLRGSGDGVPFMIDKKGTRLRTFDVDKKPVSTLTTEDEGALWKGVCIIPISGETFVLSWAPADKAARLYAAPRKRGTKADIELEKLADLEGCPEPGRMSVDRSENYFVVIPSTDEVHRYGIDGKLITKWGGTGSGPGQFSGATGIQAGVEGVYVADTGNNRVQYFDIDGTFISEWGGAGTGSAS